MTEVVAAGYNSVYASWSASAAFHELWARHAVEGGVAPGFEHLNFAGVDELERLRDVLDLRAGDRVVDLACGAGGPGAWVAHETDGVLVGVDLSRVGTGSRPNAPLPCTWRAQRSWSPVWIGCRSWTRARLAR